MELRPPSAPLRALPPETVVCIGTFDGMHLGHQALLRRAADDGRAVAAVTFEPRPAEVLAPDRAAPRLQSTAQRARICDALGVDFLVLLPFDADVAAMSPSEWAHRFVIEGLAPAGVVVGADFRFGRDRAGDVAALTEVLAPAGIACTGVELLEDGEGNGAEKIGSTAIRNAIVAGDVEHAARQLGYAHAVDGPVIRGAQRGRTLGFPTANVRASGTRPAPGVYAGWASLTDSDPTDGHEVWPAAINIGNNPTFEDTTTTGVEVHLIDAKLEDDVLYGRGLEVGFVARLRDEARFESPEALTDAIADDVAEATRRLALPGARTLRRPTPIRDRARETGT